MMIRGTKGVGYLLGKASGRKLAKKLAKGIDKEDFLRQMKVEWEPVLKSKGNFDIEKELKEVMDRIKASGMKEVFDIVGVTEDDIKGILGDIKSESKDTGY